MVRFGIIGTGGITEAFIKGAMNDKNFRVTAVYSRDLAKARAFGEKYGDDLTYFDNLEAFASSDTFDAGYIASPNSSHGPQSKVLLENGKHVLCEKAAASNARELGEVIALAKDNGLVYMEAMRSLTYPAFRKLQEILPRIGQVRKYIGNYCQYSSRYDRHKNGEYVNTFQKKFSNGSLMDIGIYAVYPAVFLFGVPDSIKASGLILQDGGVDGTGSILMSYPDMEAVILHSKISDSRMPSEIQGELGSILIDKIGNPEKLTLVLRDGTTEEIVPEQLKDNMYYEAAEFISVIESGRKESATNTHALALDVHTILDEARRQIGLSFPADAL